MFKLDLHCLVQVFPDDRLFNRQNVLLHIHGGQIEHSGNQEEQKNNQENQVTRHQFFQLSLDQTSIWNALGFALYSIVCIAFAPMDKNMKDPFIQSTEETGEVNENPIDRPLVLVGLMGVGKTTVGRRLARRIGLPFVDADHEIEKAAGLTISEIFDRFGEDYFRDGERRVIARLMDDRKQVIATGGGAFMNEETRELMLNSATVIWLDADIDILVKRVARRDTRPLLRNGNPEQILRDLAEKRNPIYAQAHVHVTGNDSPHELTVDNIVKSITQ